MVNHAWNIGILPVLVAVEDDIELLDHGEPINPWVVVIMLNGQDVSLQERYAVSLQWNLE